MNEITKIHTIQSTKNWGRGRVYNNMPETIGNTPLVRMSKIAAKANSKAEILMKMEFFNPVNSVKDRIGVSMIDVMEAQGLIRKGTVLVEPTSGNTGVALAFVAAVRDYRLILTMPESMSVERRKLLQHLGAELVLTPAAKGMKGAIERAEELLHELPDAVTPSQFSNPANPLIHEQTTAEEIWADTGGKIDALVAGVGTGGTITGCARILKARNRELKVIAVEPADSAILSGGQPGPHKIQGIGAGFVPDALDVNLVDEVVKVPNQMAFDVSRLLARLEGVAGGISTGSNMAAALTIAVRDDMAGRTIVTFAPSSAERYYTSDLFLDPDA